MGTRLKSSSENTTGKTFWDVGYSITSKLSPKHLILFLLSAIALLVGLTLTGYLKFKYFDGKFNIEIGSKPKTSEIIDQNIAGKWKAVVTDLEYNEFQRKYRHDIDLDFSLSSASDQLFLKGHLKTYDTTGVFIGEADIVGQGKMERSEFTRLSYNLTNKTVRGFGVMVLQIDPSGKNGSGFALYRRTKTQNGRFGLGKVDLKRMDAE